MPTGRDVLNTAICELGTRESPPDSNNVKYNTWYYGKPVSGGDYLWCMAFVQWCYDQAKAKLPFRTASCGALLRWYRENQPECVTEDPVPGDIVIFDWPSTKSPTDHTGIFERWDNQYVTTIDGNTGIGSDSDGGCVMRRTRPRRQVAAYIHPREITEQKPEEPMEETRYNTLDEIKKEQSWATDTVTKMLEKGILQGDGMGLDLSRDMLRLMVMADRAGLWDGKEA